MQQTTATMPQFLHLDEHPTRCDHSLQGGEGRMRMRRAFLAAARTFFVAAALLLAQGGLSRDARAQGAPSVTLDAIKASVEEIEHAVARDDISSEELAELRQKLNAVME